MPVVVDCVQGGVMRYPIVIETGDETTPFGVIVPDLPGCFSAGHSIENAMDNARESIELRMEKMLRDGITIPEPVSIETHRDNPEFVGWLWAILEIDLSKLRSTTKRYNITAPERVMSIVDIAAHQAGESRSTYLIRSAMIRFEEGIHKISVER